jgi:fluoride exporter
MLSSSHIMWSWKTILAISVGAALGALLRAALSEWLNATFPAIPPGTLLSNLIGGYLVGIAIAVFATSTLPVEWRLFVITGFCGGLTTFSTFSGEIVLLLQQGRVAWAMGAATAHLAGSILMTFAGIATVVLGRKFAG